MAVCCYASGSMNGSLYPFSGARRATGLCAHAQLLGDRCHAKPLNGQGLDVDANSDRHPASMVSTPIKRLRMPLRRA